MKSRFIEFISSFLKETRTVVGSYLTVLVLMIIGFVAVSYKFPIVRYFFETEGPTIKVTHAASGLGYAPGSISFEVQDDKSGIELVRVGVEQARIRKRIFNKEYGLNEFSHSIDLELNAEDLGLRTGNARVVVEAFDRSLKSNGNREILYIPVSFSKPKIEILSAQHNMTEYGIEMVAYNVASDDLSESGVEVGSSRFLGFPAASIDEEFEGINNLFFAFYTVNKTQNRKGIEPKVYAINKVGNKSSASFYYRVRKVRAKTFQTGSDTLSERKNAWSSLFRTLESTTYSTNRFWGERLQRVRGRVARPEVGDVFVDEQQQSYSTDYVRIEKSRSDVVVLPDAGVVSYKESNPILGGVVAVDHGFGLMSVYANLNLERTIPPIGSRIEAGSVLGKPDTLPDLQTSGIAYALVLQGSPIQPKEWWDNIWMKDHILNKIEEMKRLYNTVGKAVMLKQPLEGLR